MTKQPNLQYFALIGALRALRNRGDCVNSYVFKDIIDEASEPGSFSVLPTYYILQSTCMPQLSATISFSGSWYKSHT